MSPPLDDLTVIECGTRLSVSFCGKLLAELGARVIKVEPRDGDPARSLGPFQDDVMDPERSGLYLYLNRGKRSITLDLESTAGQGVFRRLAASADIVIAGATPSYIERNGLGYGALGGLNPRLVCTAISPFGLTGPWRDFADSELVVTALTGVGYYIPGTVEDPKTEPPLLPGAHIASCLAGLQASGATLVALNGLDTQGAGQQVDVSEQACFTDTLRMHLATYAYTGRDVDRDAGNRPVGTRPPYWLCNDGFVWGVPGPAADEHGWLNLVDAMGNPEWAQDLAMLDQAYRREHWAEIRARVEEWAITVSKHEVAGKLQAAHIPTLPVNEVSELFDNEQLQFRGSIIALDEERMPGAKVPAGPFRFGGKVLGASSPAPRLGEHTAEVLREAGYDDAEVRWLIQTRVV